MPSPAVTDSAPLVEVRALGVDFGARRVLDQIGFEIAPGEALGLIGESGSGKSTLARALLKLVPATRGTIRWNGADLATLAAAELRARRRHFQMVFQDPLASLDPRMTVGEILSEPLIVFERGKGAAAREGAALEMLERVGLPADAIFRYPHEFSGGQCQRIAIARAMMLRPRLLVCDEPVSSLDVSIQGQIVNLLADFCADLGTALLFISHNLAVVRQLAERVMVMQAGRIVEIVSCETLFGAAVRPLVGATDAGAATGHASVPAAHASAPAAHACAPTAHAYTRALLAAVPDRVFLTDAASAE